MNKPQPLNITPPLVTVLLLEILLLILTHSFAPGGETMRHGALLGVFLAATVAILAFLARARSFKNGSSMAFMAAMASSFLANLVLLAGGILLLRFMPELAAKLDYRGYAFGYLAAALPIGALLTWFLRHGR